MFITKKLGALNIKNENQIISGSSNSTLADLVKFNTNLAHSFYNITDMDTLEVSLLALQPMLDVEKLEYRDLLLSIPALKLLGKKREEVTSYLAIM